MDYSKFISNKTQLSGNFGFKPVFIHDDMFDFQKSLLEWSVMKGRSAIFADCGLGKTIIQLAWAQNIVQKTKGRVLILTPLAVGQQTKEEGDKFGIECVRSKDGKFKKSDRIVITNYEQLHKFDSKDFEGVVCDESSILKNFKGKTKTAITQFMRKMKYRLLCTATAAPNDYIELGTSSEALGDLGYMDMLQKFFKADNNTCAHGGEGGVFGARGKNVFGGKFRFRGHAEKDFWRWVCSWARAVRKPSDLGFDDGDFILPPLETEQHSIAAKTKREGCMFDMPAVTFAEQREERRRTLPERCQKVSEIVNGTDDYCIVWCNLNDEGDMLERLIPDAVQVSGSDKDERKEECFTGFKRGDFRVLVTKSIIAGLGMNFQHCNHQTFFPSYSFEQWYQAIRRSWRFGQKRPVKVDLVSSLGQETILRSLKRKSEAAEVMFKMLVDLMNNELNISDAQNFDKKESIPSWL